MTRKAIEIADIIERIRNRAIDMSYAQGLLEEAQRALDAGKTSAALECLEGADAYMTSTLDMLPIAHSATLRGSAQTCSANASTIVGGFDVMGSLAHPCAHGVNASDVI